MLFTKLKEKSPKTSQRKREIRLEVEMKRKQRRYLGYT
jgi:hypothetical protein